MFDVGFHAQIAKVAIQVKGGEGLIRRICRITLKREFDLEMARGLGPDAVEALAALKSGGFEACTMPIGAIVATGAIRCSILSTADVDEVKIPVLYGVKAKGKAGKDGDPPSIALEFSFGWDERAWVFLGRHCEAYAEIILTRTEQQLELGNVHPIGGAPRGAS